MFKKINKMACCGGRGCANRADKSFIITTLVTIITKLIITIITKSQHIHNPDIFNACGRFKT